MTCWQTIAGKATADPLILRLSCWLPPSCVQGVYIANHAALIIKPSKLATTMRGHLLVPGPLSE